MDKDTLMYLENVLMNDSTGLIQATQTSGGVDDENVKRVLNVQLEAIKADVANIQHYLDS